MGFAIKGLRKEMTERYNPEGHFSHPTVIRNVACNYLGVGTAYIFNTAQDLAHVDHRSKVSMACLIFTNVGTQAVGKAIQRDHTTVMANAVRFMKAVEADPHRANEFRLMCEYITAWFETRSPVITPRTHTDVPKVMVNEVVLQAWDKEDALRRPVHKATLAYARKLYKEHGAYVEYPVVTLDKNDMPVKKSESAYLTLVSSEAM